MASGKTFIATILGNLLARELFLNKTERMAKSAIGAQYNNQLES